MPGTFENTVDPYVLQERQVARRRRWLQDRMDHHASVWGWTFVGAFVVIFLGNYDVLDVHPMDLFDSGGGILLCVLAVFSIRAAIYLICNCLRHWSDLTWKMRIISIVIYLLSVPGMLVFLGMVYESLETLFTGVPRRTA